MATTTVTISTGVAARATLRRSGTLFSVMLAAAALRCCGWRKRRVQLVFVVIVYGLALLAGCGNSGRSASVQPVTSTVTVTTTAGSLQHSATFSLTGNEVVLAGGVRYD